MRSRVALLLGALVVLAACGGTTSREPSADPTSASPTPSPSRTASASPSPRPALGTVPPTWLGTRPLPRRADGFGRIERTPPTLRDRRFTLPDRLAPLPGRGFAARVQPAPRSVIARSTWKPGCPVATADLDWVRLAFWGFDDRRHTGELLVDRTVARDVVSVFRQLYAARFPIEEMRITRAEELDAAPTGDGNDTGAFSCRPVVGQTTYSQHAYGLAIDLNPFQNPYLKGDLVIPELASAYVDRGRRRPGMIQPGGVAVRAFASIGWGWGGDWRSLKDLQHFSANGR